MANEILILTQTPNETGHPFQYLLFFEIDPRIEINSIVHVPTPSSTLPLIVAEFNLIPQVGLDLFDSGDLMFTHTSSHRPRGLNPNDFLDIIKQRWAIGEAELVPALRENFQFTGTYLDI